MWNIKVIEVAKRLFCKSITGHSEKVLQKLIGMTSDIMIREEGRNGK